MKSKYFTFLLLCGLLLTACGASPTPAGPTPDVAAVRTSAASTVVAQFTLTAAVFTPTLPPPPAEITEAEPTATVTATVTQPVVAQVTNAEGTTIALCDKYAWDVATVDVNYPDNSKVAPGENFTKTWKIKNVGTCSWGDGYRLIYSYGERMAGEAVPLAAAIAPGQEVEVSVNFKAPELPGTYQSFWTMQNNKGIAFQGNDNKVLYVLIVVE